MIRHSNDRARAVILPLAILVSLTSAPANANCASAGTYAATRQAVAIGMDLADDLLSFNDMPLSTRAAAQSILEQVEQVETEVSSLLPSPTHDLISFLGFSHGASTYGHKLVGQDEALSAAGCGRADNYSSPEPASHRLIVQAVNSDGGLAPTAAFAAFKMLLLIRHGWWFVMALGVIFGSAVIAFARYRAALIKQIEAPLFDSRDLARQLMIQREELGKANRVLALDYAVTRALAESATAGQAAPLVIQTICTVTGWDLGALWDVDAQANQARCLGVWQNAAQDALELQPQNLPQFFLPGAGLAGRALCSREPQGVTSIAERDISLPLTAASRRGLRSGFAFPIRAGSEVMGVLEFYGRRARQPEPDLFEIMSAIEGHIGQLIQRKRAEEALRRSKEERLVELDQVRRRIAADLHDDIGSSLTRIALLSEAARQKVSDNSVDARHTLAAIAAISNEVVEQMSDVVWAINPQKDRLSDLSQRMRRFASDILTARRIRLRFRTPNAEMEVQLGANVRREVFLIFKEGINNMAKHSQCREATLDLKVEDGWLSLRMSDNGKGFEPAPAESNAGMPPSQLKGGYGLASMRRRAEELGGQLKVETGAGRGTTLLLRLPIEHGGQSKTAAATNPQRGFESVGRAARAATAGI